MACGRRQNRPGFERAHAVNTRHSGNHAASRVVQSSGNRLHHRVQSGRPDLDCHLAFPGHGIGKRFIPGRLAQNTHDRCLHRSASFALLPIYPASRSKTRNAPPRSRVASPRLTRPAPAVTIRVLHPLSTWACGAAGSALPWHGRGHRFDPDQVHQITQQLSGPPPNCLPAFCPQIAKSFRATAPQ